MIRVNTFNVVNNSKESAGHPPISGNVVNNHAPDPRSGEQLAVVLRSCCSSLSCLSFSVMCGVKKSLVSVNHFSCQCIFLGFFYASRKTHMFVLVSPQILSKYQTDRNTWWCIEVGRNRAGMAPVEFSLLTCCQGVERPNIWMQSGHSSFCLASRFLKSAWGFIRLMCW